MFGSREGAFTLPAEVPTGAQGTGGWVLLWFRFSSLPWLSRQ